MATSSEIRSWLELMPDHPEVTDAFAVADIAAVVVGSALSAWAIDARRAWAVPAVFFTAGGIVYPTLYLFGWVAFSSEDTGRELLVAMSVVSALTGWVALQTWRLSRPRPVVVFDRSGDGGVELQ